MSKANNRADLDKACKAGEEWACILLGRKNMAGFEEGFKDGGLLADASRTWRMESDYPEFEKGIADRLSKERVPEAEVEEQFNYSPLQRGYAEGGEVGNFMDETGSMLAPEVPLNFEDEMPMGDEMMMEDEMEGEEEIVSSLSPEDHEILFQALSDYPELEVILNKLGAVISEETEVFDEEGSVEGPGTGTSDSIPANLSDGEFVFTAKAVSHLGVDRLRKMMAKAESDYDEADAKQQFAQMGDEGFAAGGLLTKPKYGSYQKGGSVPKDSLGPRRQTYKYSIVKKLLKQGAISEDQIIHLSGDNFRIKGPMRFEHGGAVPSYADDEGTSTGEGTPGIHKWKRKQSPNIGTYLFEYLGIKPNRPYNTPLTTKDNIGPRTWLDTSHA